MVVIILLISLVFMNAAQLGYSIYQIHVKDKQDWENEQAAQQTWEKDRHRGKYIEYLQGIIDGPNYSNKEFDYKPESEWIWENIKYPEQEAF